jgi:hypothetical protein
MNRNALFGAIALAIAPGLANANLVDYEDLNEGFLGTSFTHQGVTYRDVNNVSGRYADGETFNPGDPGSQVIIENATLFYNDFTEYGSPINSMTFGSAYVDGNNVSIGALASVYMDFSTLVNSASFDIAYYENGPWGNIEYRLDALLNGQVVATDTFLIPGSEGRDNATFQTMSVNAAAFDSLHLYAMKDGEYTAPRGMIDNLDYAPVPEPATMAALGFGALALKLRRRRRQAK